MEGPVGVEVLGVAGVLVAGVLAAGVVVAGVLEAGALELELLEPHAASSNAVAPTATIAVKRGGRCVLTASPCFCAAPGATAALTPASPLCARSSAGRPSPVPAGDPHAAPPLPSFHTSSLHPTCY